MRIKKIALLLLAALFGVNVFSQTEDSSLNVELPQLLPASPEPAAFVKAGVGNVNLSTGAATANIPLYTIKIKDYDFPISLSYSGQGLKADEVCSRVGQGWILNATGMITRVVRGKPDEMALHLKKPSDLSADTDSVFNYFNEAANENSGYDTQPDEFQFNINGYSGKFVLDSNYIPRVTATANIKINLSIFVSQSSSSAGFGPIEITTPDGVKYHFGTNYEITTTHNIQGLSVYKSDVTTAFFLDKIKLPTGDSINFSYEPIHIRVASGITQTLKVGKYTGGLGNCVDCQQLGGYTNQVNRVEYDTKYLSSITTSDGRTISFTYEQRPDLSYDNRLKGMEVTGLKQYIFDYYDVPGTTDTSTTADVNGRFFLMKVRDIKLTEAIDTSASHDYIFAYNQLNNAPLPITFAQDYLGYYNGKANTCLIPPSLNSNNTIDFGFRAPVPSAAQIGMLTSIRYPTGGKEEYFYEANTQAKSVLRNTWVTETMNGRGDPSGTIEVYSSGVIDIYRDQTANFTLWATDADLSDGHTEDSTHWTVTVDVYEGSTVIASRSSLGYNTYTLDVELLAGHSYRWEMKVKNYTEYGHSTMYYDTASQDYYDIVNEVIPGVRVKQIKYTDQVTDSSHSKYYKYASLDNLDVSTGSGGGINFHSVAATSHYCGEWIGAGETDCSFEVYSSSSTQDVYNYSGSGSVIYYKTVIESDDPDFGNGGTEYTFYENEKGDNHLTLRGQDVLNLPAGQTPTLSGKLFQSRTFDKDKNIVKREQYDYETMIDLTNAVESYYVRTRYQTYITILERMDAFDAVKMLYGNYWIRLKTKTSTIYVGTDSSTQITDYTYGQSSNILPAAIVTKDSKNLEIKTETKYPTDFPTDAAFAKMISRNIITPVVEQSSYRNSTLQQKKYITYKDWFSDTSILAPEKVQIKESPSDALHDALIYARYDNSGNPLQLQKSDDISIVYLWDAKHSLPQCEVKNAVFEQVAFCSFEEAGNYGNWQLSSGSAVSPGFTGSYSFTGTVTRTITTAGSYIVRLWTNSSATVNGSGGTAITTVQGWTLYQWQLTNPSTITVSGTRLDDLRLYPQNAVMTTYTYRPFVGVTSISDANSKVQFYEYDYMGRLSFIRDQDNNILKRYCYNYAGEPEDCGMDMTPLWQSTGVTRCKPCPSDTAYFSNIQQHQEKDNNPYSTSYDSTRWVDDGVSENCIPQADWQVISTTCQLNGSGQNTGYQIKTEKDMNPCSPSYDSTRQVNLYNTTACPLPVTCNTSNCSGNDRKCINGVCEVGTLVVVSSVWQKVLIDGLYQWRWVCTKKYCFSDGTTSTYSEQTYQTSSCSVQFCTVSES